MYPKKRKAPSDFTYPGTPIRAFGPSRKDMKKKAYVTKEQLSKAISSSTEPKIFDLTMNIANVTYAGTIIDLCPVPQGVTEVTRIGDELLPKRLEIRMNFINADAYNMYRAIIFRWKQNDTVAPTVGGIIESSGPSTTQSVYVPLNVNTRSTFEVLYDKTFNTNAVSVANKFVKINLKLAKKKIEYSFSSTAGQNKIYMLIISDSSTATHPTHIGYSRLIFTDS